MPLSEHEQRLLDQIERALYDEDPKFASAYRSTDLRRHHTRRIVRCGGAFLVGVLLLLAGVVTAQWPVGVLGFVVMLASLVIGVTAWQRLTGSRTDDRRVRTPSRRNRSAGSGRGGATRSGRGSRTSRGPRPAGRGGPLARLEERWRRRWDERGY